MQSFSFQKQVLERSNVKPVLVEFSIPGCGPCKWMENTLIDIVRTKKDQIEFISIPILAAPEAIEKYNISSNPTTLLFSKGQLLSRINGALPKMVIDQWLNDHLTA